MCEIWYINRSYACLEILCKTFYMDVFLITDMVIMQNFKDLSDNFQAFWICTNEKFAQKEITNFCDY
jgi:hypothetical protein